MHTAILVLRVITAIASGAALVFACLAINAAIEGELRWRR